MMDAREKQWEDDRAKMKTELSSSEFQKKFWILHNKKLVDYLRKIADVTGFTGFKENSKATTTEDSKCELVPNELLDQLVDHLKNKLEGDGEPPNEAVEGQSSVTPLEPEHPKPPPPPPPPSSSSVSSGKSGQPKKKKVKIVMYSSEDEDDQEIQLSADTAPGRKAVEVEVTSTPPPPPPKPCSSKASFPSMTVSRRLSSSLKSLSKRKCHECRHSWHSKKDCEGHMSIAV